MATYLDVPKTSGNALFDFYEQGVNVAEYAGAGHIATAYYDDSSEYSIRLAVYNDGNVHFVFLSHVSIASIDIRLVGGALSELSRGNSITMSSSYGYYLDLQYTPTNPVFNLDVFNDLQTLLETVGWSTPAPDSGVVVIANAAPIYQPPSTEGVIVYAVARLLDPNQQGGTSEPGGGQGTFDESSDPIPIPPLPTIGAANAGLITLFRPTLLQLQSLGSYLWTGIDDFIENLNKIFANPMDYIIALNIFPCNPEVDTARNINIGSFTTSIQMPPVKSQWYDFNCGTIRINEFWGSALDYAPNTKITAFLPFIGSVSLNVDEVMGHSIGCRYRIDLLSGQCVAMITVDDNVYYQFTGECSVSVPLTGADWSRVYTAAIGAIGTAITGGISAAGVGVVAGQTMATNAVAKSTQATARAANSVARLPRGNDALRTDLLNAAHAASEAAQLAASAPSNASSALKASRVANTINNTVGQVTNGKIGIQHSGTISGSSGMLGVKVPYVLIEFPNQSLAENYRHYVGYPSNMSGKLSAFSGYTECEQVIPSGFTGTDDELSELLEALKGGVYL